MTYGRKQLMLINYSSMLYLPMLSSTNAQCNFSLLELWWTFMLVISSMMFISCFLFYKEKKHVARYIHTATQRNAFTSLFKVKLLFRLFPVLSKLYEHSKSTLYCNNTSHVWHTKGEKPTFSATKQVVNPAEAN